MLSRIALIFAFALAVSAFSCDKDKGVYDGQWKIKDRTVSPKGVAVHSSYAKVNPAILPEIDKGLDKVFEIASNPPYNYQLRHTHKDYLVTVFPRSPKCMSPGMITTAYQPAWDQTEYDKDDRPGHTALCFAGAMMLQNQATKPGMIVVDSVAIMAQIVRFEGEHNVLAFHDIQKFIQTKDNHSHPLLPDANGNFAGEAERDAVHVVIDKKEWCVMPVH